MVGSTKGTLPVMISFKEDPYGWLWEKERPTKQWVFFCVGLRSGLITDGDTVRLRMGVRETKFSPPFVVLYTEPCFVPVEPNKGFRPSRKVMSNTNRKGEGEPRLPFVQFGFFSLEQHIASCVKKNKKKLSSLLVVLSIVDSEKQSH